MVVLLGMGGADVAVWVHDSATNQRRAARPRAIVAVTIELYVSEE
jgi:hypothetical protein